MSPATAENFLPPRILVIDDNHTVHDAFDGILRHDLPNSALAVDEALMFGESAEGGVIKPVYELDHAMSGLEGVEKIRQAVESNRPYQVAFVDIRMPGIDGVETIERFWKLDTRIQTVICTAYADYRWEDLAKRLGQTDRLLLLKKPFHNIEVLQMASTLVQKWFLAKQAALKFEQMEVWVAQRTQKLLELQRRENSRVQEPAPANVSTTGAAAAVPPTDATGEIDLPVVLLIDDNSDRRALIHQGLAGEYAVMKASGSAQGIIAAQENVPDLIVVDDEVSARAGMKLCADLKRNEMTSHIPVILLATDDSDVSQVCALEAGVNEFLVKPLRLPLLKARMDNLLENRRKLHEHFQQLQSVQPRELAANRTDAEFLQRVVAIVEKNLSDYEFDVETLARQLGVSRRQLFRKFKAIAGCTPNVFMRDIRLKHAAQLLLESQLTVSEIIFAVGFSDPKYFRTVFRERFGVLPGEYGKRLKPES